MCRVVQGVRRGHMVESCKKLLVQNRPGCIRRLAGSESAVASQWIKCIKNV